jgi:hypothetical protein
MLSPQAARMRLVKTTIRQIGGFDSSRRYFGVAVRGERGKLLGSGTSRNNNTLTHPLAALSSDARRWKSTVAAYDDSDDEETSNKSRGHAEAALARSATTAHSHEESWMINLGRDGDNEWLLKTRDPDDWFTGKKPSICPGELLLILMHGSTCMFHCRSLN